MTHQRPKPSQMTQPAAESFGTESTSFLVPEFLSRLLVWLREAHELLHTIERR
jgi:hypothetical protein